MNHPQLWQHQATGARYIVLEHEGTVMLAAGPLSSEQLAHVQATGNIDWTLRAIQDGEIVEQHRQEYVRVFPQGDMV